MTYSLLLSDLGGVVVDFEADRLVHQISQLLGRSFEDVQQAVYHEELLLPFELGRITPMEYYEGLKERLGFSWSYPQFVRAWNDILRENPEVTRVLRQLRQDCRLVALSNTNELHLRYIKQAIPSLSIFHEWIGSCDVGLRKPDPQIYRFALERMGVEARAAVYVDDRPELVEAGSALGLTAIRFQSSRQLAKDLQALGFAVQG